MFIIMDTFNFWKWLKYTVFRSVTQLLIMYITQFKKPNDVWQYLFFF
jgi:hypothetical protein